MSVLSIVLVNVKGTNSRIKELILMASAVIVYLLPLEVSQHFFTSLYDVQIMLVLSISYALSMVFGVEANIQKRCIKIIKVMLPLLILMLNVISFDLRMILSVVLYILLEEEKRQSLLMMSYLIISLFVVNWFISDYFDSLLSIVNYQVLDIQKYTLLIGAITAAMCTVISISIWNDNKQRNNLEIFWPIVYLVTSHKLLSTGSLNFEHTVVLMIVLALSFFIYRNESIIILVLSLIIGMLQLHPLFIAFGIGLLVIVAFRDLIPKITLFETVEKLKFLDVICVLILVFTLQGEVAILGVSSIAMFLLAIKSITASYYIE